MPGIIFFAHVKDNRLVYFLCKLQLLLQNFALIFPLLFFPNPIIINTDLTHRDHLRMPRQFFYFLKSLRGEFLKVGGMEPDRRIHTWIFFRQPQRGMA